jgi:hypothetical protein
LFTDVSIPTSIVLFFDIYLNSFRPVESVSKAKTATKVLFGGDLEEIGADSIIQAFAHDNQRLRAAKRDQILNVGLDAVSVLAGATRSKCKCH